MTHCDIYRSPRWCLFQCYFFVHTTVFVVFAFVLGGNYFDTAANLTPINYITQIDADWTTTPFIAISTSEVPCEENGLDQAPVF